MDFRLVKNLDNRDPTRKSSYPGPTVKRPSEREIISVWIISMSEISDARDFAESDRPRLVPNNTNSLQCHHIYFILRMLTMHLDFQS